MQYTYSSHFVPEGSASLKVVDLLLRAKYLQDSKGGTYDEPLEVLRVPFDTHMLSDVSTMATKMQSTNLKYIFIVGIGGSSLGTRAISEALLLTGDFSKIVFLESIDARRLSLVSEICKSLKGGEEFVINIISKAGATTETISNFSLLCDMLSHVENWKERIVVTTTKESDLARIATSEGYNILYMPKEVSGRYSVFTAVGLFPLLLAGYPVNELLEGARASAKLIGTPHDPSRRLAEDIVKASQGGAHMIDFFFFNTELESLGKWGRQLYAESLGKEHDRNGKVVHTGITPTVTVGTEDLHSMVQLYFGGPKDRLTLLIPPFISDRYEIKKSAFTSLIPGLEGRTGDEVNAAIYSGVHATFISKRIPFAEVRFAKCNAHMLGAFMQWHMQVVPAVAESFNIHAFDQPTIEDYKKVTRSLLLRK